MSTTLWILTALAALLNVFTVYLAIIFFFTFKRRRSYPKAAPDTRFAVIIPARNEGHVVGKLIDALRRQDYPSDKIDIYVAVNNTTDNTEAVSIAAGAKVIRCEGKITNKGQVLHQAFEKLMPMGYDAFAIFDADNVPAPDFMQRMNDALAAGERVCKGRLKAGNFADSWVSGCYGLHHAMMEWGFSYPHTAAGFSSNLVGTAFVTHREVIEQLGGWNTFSICEDTEFAAQASRIGHRVAYVYDALSYDEQVSSFPVSLRQRHRWCYGMMQCARRMTLSMFSRRCPKKGMARDFGMMFIISHAAPLGGLIGTVAMFLQPSYMYPFTAAGFVLSWIGMTLLGAYVCRFGGYPMRRMWSAILLYPLFTLSWAPLQILAIFVPVRHWSEIRHNGQGETSF